jgi:hypothetical protein
MLFVKKFAFALSLAMLAACGPSQVTKVDGTSVATADQSLRAIEKGLKLNENDQIAYEVDVQMLHYRYEGMEFAKVLDGKDIDGIRAEVANTKAYFLAENRKRHVAIEQKKIDDLNEKIASVSDGRRKMEPDFDPETSVWTSGDLARVKHYKELQQTYMTMDAEEFWKEYGCGCETYIYDKKVKVL